ncbi:TLP18.3, Psb32 and MOLO-1 founding protein of phosphatase [Filimonas lacunae]|uniref:TLP18.3, Psb32 and MOLO-1 founding protein of phosphatase n=1 Tax=Filimonas lacunae TaxID=477680 RepID=A0A173M9Q6_9BACT|nr:TPM domain-containing protein [Filimonas lacunae]BAV04265.1 hypothetical protein FLA_0246 [Filimonas lacunae]SIT13339.1 TLP18.3, Psb32 and MOLO-1 founding protein of phosphatase [Filimonas lacunae]
MFGIFSKKPAQFFTASEQEKIVQAIKTAELQTSGEVRVFIESKCRFVDPIDRAKEMFARLEMEKTELRNGVLVYVAVKSRQLAIYADEAIYQKAGTAFWQEEVLKMLRHFNKENYAEGIASVVLEIGEVLKYHFPYNAATDVNELPDDIVFGK